MPSQLVPFSFLQKNFLHRISYCTVTSPKFHPKMQVKHPATTKKPINLLRGWPNPSLLPTTSILSAAQTSLTTPSIAIPGLLYGPDPGFQPLRQEIAKWMERFYGGGADEERICITGGASQNLACVLQVFSDPVKTRVWMVTPSYFLAECIFEDVGVRIAGVGEGREGVDVEQLERKIRRADEEDGDVKALKKPQRYSKIYRHIIYCVPTFSNPSGKTMSLSARKKLVQLARKYDALIITDDVYDFLQFSTTSSKSSSSLSTATLPRLIDIDRTLEPVPGPDDFGNAMSNGSFSKIAGPGVRTGWSDASRKFTYALSQCGSSRSGGAPSQLVATMMYEMLKNGSLEKHIETILRPAYQKRYELMVGAIEKSLVPLGVKLGETDVDGQGVFGGYFIWIELPKNVSAEVVAKRTKEEENLIVAPGHIFEVSNDRSIKFENSLRLCFAWEEEADLVEGVLRLARIVKEILEGGITPANENGSSGEGFKQDLGELK